MIYNLIISIFFNNIEITINYLYNKAILLILMITNQYIIEKNKYQMLINSKQKFVNIDQHIQLRLKFNCLNFSLVQKL